MAGRQDRRTFVGIEAGGTKFVCLVGVGPDEIVAERRFPTATPDQTLELVGNWVADQCAHHAVDAIGLASFGPVDLDPTSATHGQITSTPKPGWAGTDMVGWLEGRFRRPVGFDTDVNAAVLAEHRWGAGVGLDDVAYVTVGTGVGGAAVSGGQLVHGLLHTEMGHVPVRRHPDDDQRGGCPYHGDCLEGLAAGPAIAARHGRPGQDLDREAAAGAARLEAFYLAQLMVTLTYVLSPRRIILGGGVTQLPGLFDHVRLQTRTMLAGALTAPMLAGDLDDYIVPAQLGHRAGALGALALARAACSQP